MRMSDWSSDVWSADLMNDAQKTMGIIALLLVSAQSNGVLDDLPGILAFLHPSPGALTDGDIDLWIKLTCAVVMEAGTAAGGWRIIKKLGHKLVKLHPIHGIAAEASAASVTTLASSEEHTHENKEEMRN